MWQVPVAASDRVPASLGGAFPTSLGGFPTSLGGGLPPVTEEGIGRPAVTGTGRLPPGAAQTIEPFEADGLDLHEVLYALSLQYDTRISASDDLRRPVTIRLPAVPLVEALDLLSRQESLDLHSDGSGFYMAPAGSAAPPHETPTPPLPAEASTTAGALHPLPGTERTSDSHALGSNDAGISYDPIAPGFGPGEIQAGGYPAQPYSAPAESSDSFAGAPVPSGVVVREGLVSVNVEDTSVADILAQLARQTGLSLVAQSGADTRVTARWSGVRIDDALRILLMGTNLTFHREGNTVVVADRQLPGMLTSKLIRLRHVPAGGLVERLPDALRQNATHQLIQEQNGLIVTAPADVVAATEAYLRAIDQPTDQILLEVLVVEFETTGLRQLGVTFLGGLLPAEAAVPQSADGSPGWLSYLFGGGDDQRGGLDILGDGKTGNDFLNFWSDLLGIRSIGHLPTDFYFRLQALERTGKAEIRSRPHIATLNGHTASISVGTSQYYILKSIAPIQAPGLYTQGQAEHFEYVQADVRLEITPWVTESGDVTASIRPSFTTPVGAFDPRVPPTLHNWSVDTSVRLKDGETFMIGGLIQDREIVMENRVPFLGRIPLLGRLFRNSERQKHTSELVIFITPHLLHDEADPASLHDRLGPAGRRALVAPVGGAGW